MRVRHSWGTFVGLTLRSEFKAILGFLSKFPMSIAKETYIELSDSA